MATPILPTHLAGCLAQGETRRGAMRRLHNQRVVLAVAPDGSYQLQITKVLKSGEAAELRRLGHRDTTEDYILRDRLRYSLIQLTPEAFEAAVWCQAELQWRQQLKRA